MTDGLSEIVSGWTLTSGVEDLGDYIAMTLFGGRRRAMLEVQNLALIKTAEERATRIAELERELEPNARVARRLAQAEGELVQMQGRLDHATRQAEGERVQMQGHLDHAKRQLEERTTERDFYRRRVEELEQANAALTTSATKYSLWGQSSSASSPR
jgi:chromosome segregation ATPase